MIDLNTVEPQALQALTRLREPELRAAVDLVASELGRAKRQLVREGDMVMIHRLQGRAEAFEDLLRAVDEAPEVVQAALRRGERSTP